MMVLGEDERDVVGRKNQLEVDARVSVES